MKKKILALVLVLTIISPVVATSAKSHDPGDLPTSRCLRMSEDPGDLPTSK